MKISNEAARLKTAVQHAPVGCVVYVTKQYARHFTAPPRDGRTYLVEDPLRDGVHHLSLPDGTYKCMEKCVYPYKVPGLPLTRHEKRVKGKKPKKKSSRVAKDFSTEINVHATSDASPAISLIDIHRVMRICGFRKSFIYEQADFPVPVKLGESRRSPVRWVENEVVAWVYALASKRITNTAT